MGKDERTEFEKYVEVRKAELGIDGNELAERIGKSPSTLTGYFKKGMNVRTMEMIVQALEQDFTIKYKG